MLISRMKLSGLSKSPSYYHFVIAFYLIRTLGALELQLIIQRKVKKKFIILNSLSGNCEICPPAPPLPSTISTFLSP